MSFRISRCCAAICCGIALLSFAATDSNTISGIVRDESGKPVATVTIVLTGSQAGSPVIKTQSGETGEYRFTGLAPGDYTITAEFSGYAMQAQPIHLPHASQAVAAASGFRNPRSHRSRRLLGVCERGCCVRTSSRNGRRQTGGRHQWPHVH
jgi:hypothetical protein